MNARNLLVHAIGFKKKKKRLFFSTSSTFKTCLWVFVISCVYVCAYVCVCVRVHLSETDFGKALYWSSRCYHGCWHFLA